MLSVRSDWFRRLVPPVVVLIALLAVLTGCGGTQTTSSARQSSPARLIIYSNSGRRVLAECLTHPVGHELLLEPTRNSPGKQTLCAGRRTPVTREVTVYSNITRKVIAQCRVQFIGSAPVVAVDSASHPNIHPNRLCLTTSSREPSLRARSSIAKSP